MSLFVFLRLIKMEISVRRETYDMALEDCLDMLADQQENETQSQKRVRELEDAQEKLLQVVETYQEQMWDMQRYVAENDPAWIPQLELSQSAVKGKMISGGITLIDEIGAEVDYTYHEVVEARDTAEDLKARTVAEIFHPGYAYKGVVKKKAKVAAYRNRSESNVFALFGYNNFTSFSLCLFHEFIFSNFLKYCIIILGGGKDWRLIQYCNGVSVY